MMTHRKVMVWACCLLFLASAHAGIRPQPRIREFRGGAYYDRGVQRPYRPYSYMVRPETNVEGYRWAVYREHLYRHEERFQREELDFGPVWVARRQYGYGTTVFDHQYDLFKLDGRWLHTTRADGVFWQQDDPPPPIEFYWTDRLAPDWFSGKKYDLFVQIAPRKWWARSSDGKWDVIDDGKLGEEAGKGPAIETPEIRLPYHARYDYRLR